MSRQAPSKLAMLFALATVAVGLGGFVATPASAQLDAYSQVAPELAQPDKVKTSAADAADAAAAKASALAALDRALPACAKATAAKKESSKGSNVSTSCALVRPQAEDPADDPSWGQFEASYAGTVWLPPTPAAAKKTHIKAAGSYYQVSGREREKRNARGKNAASVGSFFFLLLHSSLSQLSLDRKSVV